VIDAIARPSPNFDARDCAVDMIVLHYTGMTDCESALHRLCDPAAKVSAHYLIDEDGTLYALVDEAQRAWHAGVASWHGETDINGCAVGIELVNPGHEFGYRAFPEAQMQTLEVLCRDVMERHDVSAARVVGHADVAPARKTDPGELFDWERLAASGLALSVDGVLAEVLSPVAPGDEGDEVAALQASLAAVGYGLVADGHYGEETAAVVRAFQRRFRQAAVDGIADAETAGRLAAYLALIDDV